MFIAIYQKVPTVAIVQRGIERYRERHGREATVVLCSSETAELLGDDTIPIRVKYVNFVPKGVIYVGVEDAVS